MADTSLASSAFAVKASLPQGCRQSVAHALLVCAGDSPAHFSDGFGPLSLAWGWVLLGLATGTLLGMVLALSWQAHGARRATLQARGLPVTAAERAGCSLAVEAAAAVLESFRLGGAQGVQALARGAGHSSEALLCQVLERTLAGQQKMGTARPRRGLGFQVRPTPWRGRSSCAPGAQHVGRGGLLRAKACFVSATAVWLFWLLGTLCSNRWRLCRAVLAAFVTRKLKRHIAEPAVRSFCCSGWCRARLFLRRWTPWSAPCWKARRSCSGSWPTPTRGRRLTKSGAAAAAAAVALVVVEVAAAAAAAVAPGGKSRSKRNCLPGPACLGRLL